MFLWLNLKCQLNFFVLLATLLVLQRFSSQMIIYWLRSKYDNATLTLTKSPCLTHVMQKKVNIGCQNKMYGLQLRISNFEFGLDLHTGVVLQ